MDENRGDKDSFEDMMNFLTFIDECLGVDFFMVDQKVNEVSSEVRDVIRTSDEENSPIGLFDGILHQHSVLGDPYILIMEEKRKLLEDVASRISSCKLCELHRERKRAVPGDGNPTASVIFVGEAPGYEEDRKGRPFVGKSGNLLTSKIKEFLGMSRTDVFITNVVRCRPPQNRTPEKGEIEICSKYLFEEIEIICPELVVALGAPAAKVLTMKDEKITELRGNFYKRPNYMVFVTFHPAYVLRNPSVMELFDEDFRKIAEFLRAT